MSTVHAEGDWGDYRCELEGGHSGSHAIGIAQLEASNERLEAENEDWSNNYGKHLDQYNSWIHTTLHEKIDATDIPSEGKEGKYKVLHTGMGRLGMLIEAYNENQAEFKKLVRYVSWCGM
jgi:hypothetical protein